MCIYVLIVSWVELVCVYTMKLALHITSGIIEFTKNYKCILATEQWNFRLYINIIIMIIILGYVICRYSIWCQIGRSSIESGRWYIYLYINGIQQSWNVVSIIFWNIITSVITILMDLFTCNVIFADSLDSDWIEWQFVIDGFVIWYVDTLTFFAVNLISFSETVPSNFHLKARELTVSMKWIYILHPNSG